MQESCIDFLHYEKSIDFSRHVAQHVDVAIITQISNFMVTDAQAQSVNHTEAYQ